MKLRRLDPRSWPLRVKVPLLVAALMVVVGTVASQIVLLRLAATQETYLRQLSSAYLDGLSTALVPHVARRDAWETFDVLAAAVSATSGWRSSMRLSACRTVGSSRPRTRTPSPSSRPHPPR